MSGFGQGYIGHKAARLLEVGFEAYRKEDAFKYPPRKLSPREADNIKKGAQQLVNRQGYDSSTPIRDIDLNDLILLMACFHFALKRKSLTSEFNDECWNDTAVFQHVMTEQEVTIYLSGNGEERHQRNRRLLVFQSIGPDYPPALKRLPALSEHRVHDSGMLGEYRYAVWTDCQSEGSIEYHHLMVCWAPESSVPCLVIALEQIKGAGTPLMLCAFWQYRHSNYGSASELLDLPRFQAKALEKAQSLLLEHA